MTHRLLSVLLLAALAAPFPVRAAEESLASPDGRVVVFVNDADGLHYRVTLDGQPALADSRLGFDFEGGFSLGRRTTIERTARTEHDETWDNPFGPRRAVRDHCRELKLELQEHADAPGRLNLIVRAYDNGVAFRYELPVQPGLENYVVTN